jgi:hypothetical protein
MVRVRKASRAGVTARFVAGHFTVTRDGVTEPVTVDSHPDSDLDIMHALEDILDRY